MVQKELIFYKKGVKITNKCSYAKFKNFEFTFFGL